MPDRFTTLLAVLWLLAAIWTLVRAIRETKLSGFCYPIYSCLPFMATAVLLSVGFALAHERIYSSPLFYMAFVLGVGFLLPAGITVFSERRARSVSPEQWERWNKIKKNTSAIRSFFFYAGVKRGAASQPVKTDPEN